MKQERNATTWSKYRTIKARVWPLAAVLLLATGQGSAAVYQPGSTLALPRPTNAAELALVGASFKWNKATTSWKSPEGVQLAEPIVFGEYYSAPSFPQLEDGDAITLQGFFKWRRETLDPQLDAKVSTEGFTPKCPFTVEPVLVGGDCDARIGWYNVPNPVGSSPPGELDIYEIVPANLETFLSCKTINGAPNGDGFCPLAWDNRSPVDLSIRVWQPERVTLDLSKDPRYLGGAIGLTLQRGDGKGAYCSPSVYSVAAHNTKSAGGDPFVGALVYESVVEAGAVYVAFDDGLMLPNDWTNKGSTDGDYNDYVGRISAFLTTGPDGGAGGAAGGAANGGDGGLPGSAGNAGSSDGGASRGGAPNESGPGGSDDVANEPHAGGFVGSDGGESVGGAMSGQARSSRESQGCGCRTASASHAGAPWLVAGLAIARMVRRRKSRPQA